MRSDQGITSDAEQLLSHPKLGASWEGLVIELIRDLRDDGVTDFHFWATHAGAELDLLVVGPRGRVGIEVKRTSAPRVTPSMSTALEDPALESLLVIHAGEHAFPLAEKIEAVPAARLVEGLAAISHRAAG